MALSQRTARNVLLLCQGILGLTEDAIISDFNRAAKREGESSPIELDGGRLLAAQDVSLASKTSEVEAPQVIALGDENGLIDTCLGSTALKKTGRKQLGSSLLESNVNENENEYAILQSRL